LRRLRACDDVNVDAAELVTCPPDGRRVTRSRRVRLGDVTASGRLRLDALARYLQDVAADDADEVGMAGAWVLRRTTLELGDLPRYREEVELTTFCSGTGGRIAERRTTLTVDGRVAAEAAAIWVYVDREGRPARLERWFFELYASAANGRKVNGRLHHTPPPPDVSAARWPLRRADVDVLAHVNNAVSFAAVEDALAEVAAGRRLVRAEIEYRAPVDVGEELELRTRLGDDELRCWLTVDSDVRTSAVVGLA
jgi:acyl-ACP thioesterase